MNDLPHVHFGNARELMRQAEALEQRSAELAEGGCFSPRTLTYECDSLNNLAGELRCVANEVEQRLRAIQDFLADRV